MTTKLLFFVTIWTGIAALLAFMVVGLMVNAEHWWQQRHTERKL